MPSDVIRQLNAIFNGRIRSAAPDDGLSMHGVSDQEDALLGTLG
jgi:hypothetical protein